MATSESNVMDMKDGSAERKGEEPQVSGFPKFHEAGNTFGASSSSPWFGWSKDSPTTVVVATLVVAVVLHRLFFSSKGRDSPNTGNERVLDDQWGNRNPRPSRTGQSRLLREMENRRRREEPETSAVEGGKEENMDTAVKESTCGAKGNGDDDLYAEVEVASALVAEAKSANEACASENGNDEKKKWKKTAVSTDSGANQVAANPSQKSRATTSAAPAAPPALKSKKNHPGLTEFHVWHNSVCDLYRSYVIGPADPNKIVPVPVLPKSERGVVPVEVEVTNRTAYVIDVYWVDHLGGEQWKGYANPEGGTWRQTTWIGHPWIFRARTTTPTTTTSHDDTTNAATGRLLLHFVPFRIVPTTNEVSTVRPPDPMAPQRRDEDVGLQKFTIGHVRSDWRRRLAARSDDPDPAVENACEVDDPVLPFPSDRIQSVEAAVEWSCAQMEREDRSPATLLRYLRNILSHPGESKYRRIRTSNPAFLQDVWTHGGRGVLHALGFEQHGPHVEMGSSQGNLPPDRIKDVSGAIFQLELLQKRLDSPDRPHQPQGADGFGRGGFGRAGQLNFRR